MADTTDDITINYSLTYDASPIAHRYMMACPSHLRRRRMSRLIPHACEVVLRTMQLGGRMYSGGSLNTTEFAAAESSEEAIKWRSIPFSLTVSREITPFFYDAIKSRSLDHCKQVINAALEAYVLTVGATTAPPDQVEPIVLAYSTAAVAGSGSEPASAPMPSGLDTRADSPRSSTVERTADPAATEPEMTVAPPQAQETAALASESREVYKDDLGRDGKPEPDPNSQRIMDLMKKKGPAS